MITILVSFVGALLIVRPGFAEINIGMLAIFAAGPAFASSELIAKKLKADYDDNMIIITLSMLIALLLFIPALLVWQPMTLFQWIGVCLIGLLATLAHVAIMRSFRGPMWASQSGKFIQLLFVAAFGFILFDEIPAMTTWAGAFLVLSSISYIAFVEARKHKS
jgi:drug/metabolite transporter (DMT)-like permease